MLGREVAVRQDVLGRVLKQHRGLRGPVSRAIGDFPELRRRGRSHDNPARSSPEAFKIAPPPCPCPQPELARSIQYPMGLCADSIGPLLDPSHADVSPRPLGALAAGHKPSGVADRRLNASIAAHASSRGYCAR